MNQTPTTLTDLFKESVIFQGALTVICLVGTFVLLVARVKVPQYVYLLDGTVIGFFGGAQSADGAQWGASYAEGRGKFGGAERADCEDFGCASWNAGGECVNANAGASANAAKKGSDKCAGLLMIYRFWMPTQKIAGDSDLPPIQFTDFA